MKIDTHYYYAMFSAFAGALFGLAGLAIGGPLAWFCYWVAVACVLIAAAYVFNWPWIFGKRDDGTINALRLIPVWPYQFFFWLYWQGERRLSSMAAFHEVAPNLYVGRRPLPHEVPSHVDLVVDLTAELPTFDEIRARGYVNHRIIDGAVPTDAQAYRQLLLDIAAHPGVVAIHCASGRGRASMTAAGAMVARGDAPDIRAAVRRIREIRTGIRPTSTQVEYVARVIEE